MLDWLIDGGGYDTQPRLAHGLRSPVFHYLDGSWTPAVDPPRTFDERRDAYRELSTARHIVIVSGRVTAVTPAGTAMFEGGDVDAIDTGRFACAVRVASQPTLIVSLRQSTAAGNHSAQRSATQQAVLDAFWTEATKQLATIAPGATLLVK